MKNIISIAIISMIAFNTINAESKENEPKFCNIVFADTDKDIIGFKRFLEGAKNRGIYDKIKFTVLMHSDKADINDQEQKKLYKQLYSDGHEIGAWYVYMRPKLADWLDIPVSEMTTSGFQLFGDPDVLEQAEATLNGITASLNLCIEGDSFKEEFWDVPHNWEGASWLPYWVQWDKDKPTSTARVNRELHKDNASLELQWATRTMWDSYDRISIPQNFHFGEPVKKTQWPFSPLIKRGDISWWRDEIDQLELNLKEKRTPFLYINTASEMNVFTPKGAWDSFLDPNEALDCALDFIQLLIDNGWQLITVKDFAEYYKSKWPCPSAPSAIFLMEDTLAGHKDQQGLTVPAHGRLLRAETKYFQIIEHEKRMTPEMVVAYGLETPNLLRGGYTFGNPDLWHFGENKNQYASTSGNAIFWSPTEALVNSNGDPYYHSNKPDDAYNRAYTFYLGDDWERYQFTDSIISDIRRDGDAVSWTKTMKSSIPGTDIKIKYQNEISGPEHRIHIIITGKDAEGLSAKLRLSPYFHQGWDNDYIKAGADRDPKIPDPSIAGQERNVFARVGTEEFSYSESNIITKTKIIQLGEGKTQLDIFNRNPGNDPSSPGWTMDDNPDMNRGLSASFESSNGYVEMYDPAGRSNYITATINFGKHTSDKDYDIVFTYWHGNK